MPRAGLNPETVTKAAAAVADEVGLDHLSISLVAERLGVRGPSLYKHIDGLTDLTHRIGVLAANELTDALSQAMQGRACGDALAAAGHTIRDFVTQHPGRYAATFGLRIAEGDDPQTIALQRTLGSFTAVVRGYQLPPADEIHALRMLRSILHGFATLEASDGFKMSTDVDASFAWMLGFIDRSLRASTAP